MEISYFAAFIAGLLGGVHCLGMCGGIVGALTFGLPEEQRENPLSMLPYLIAYNLGRLSSYTVAGILLGGVMMLAANLVAIKNVQMVLEVFAALLMLALGLYLGGWWRGLTRIEHIGGKIWKYIEPFSRRFIPVKTIPQAFILGLLWGWLPCGLVYTILFWSITTGSAVEGGLLMLSFGVGTLPLLLTMGVFAAGLSSFIRHTWVRYTAGGMVIAFALYNLFNVGMRL